MRASRPDLGFVYVFGLALAFGGCTKPSTVLLVEVEGPMDVQPNQLRVTVTAGGIDARVIKVPAMPLGDGDKMRFPTSFTISIDQSHTAPFGVSIDAFDDVGGVQAPIGYSGTTTYNHVEIGGQTTVTVVLTEVAAPNQPDGGLDGAAGDGGTAGASGATGAGGGGAGSGGAGGAAGQDAGAGETGDAGLGLDGAAD